MTIETLSIRSNRQPIDTADPILLALNNVNANLIIDVFRSRYWYTRVLPLEFALLTYIVSATVVASSN
jgi:hypothetical protein